MEASERNCEKRANRKTSPLKSQNRCAEEGKITGRVEITQREGASAGRGVATAAEVAREAAEASGDVRRKDERERRIN